MRFFGCCTALIVTPLPLASLHYYRLWLLSEKIKLTWNVH